MFHTESLLLRQADGGRDPIWGGKIIQSIQYSQQSLRGKTELGVEDPRAPHLLYETLEGPYQIVSL